MSYALRALRRPQLRDPRVLERWRSGMPRPGTFSRGSVGTYIDPALFTREAAAHVPRTVWQDPGGTGVLRPYYRSEGARTNVLHDSSNFAASGTAWSGGTGFAISAVTSILSGQTAYRHTNDGLAASRNRSQARGVFTGTPETVYQIFERVDATVTELALFNDTTAATVCRVRLTWATGAGSVVAGSGTVRVERLALVGPNGGALYLLAVTATGVAGNSRRVIVYPSGTGTNTEAVILHHAQHEAAATYSSAMVTGSADGFTRQGDALSTPWPHSPQTTVTGYLRFVERGTAALASSDFGLLGISTTGTRFGVWGSPLFPGGYRAELVTAMGEFSGSDCNNPVSIGDTVEVLVRVRKNGTCRLDMVRNGGALVLGGEPAVPASGRIGDAWSAAVKHTGSRSGASNAGFNDFAAEVWLEGEPTLDECREAAT